MGVRIERNFLSHSFLVLIETFSLTIVLIRTKIVSMRIIQGGTCDAWKRYF